MKLLHVHTQGLPAPPVWPYSDAPPLAGRLGGKEGLVSVGPLYPQEAVSGVANATGKHTLPQHGVDYRALSIAGPEATARSASGEAINRGKAS